MAGEDLILQALMKDSEKRSATNPWRLGGLAVTQQPRANFNNPWASGLATLSQTLLGGLMSGYGQESQQAQNDKLLADYMKAASGENTKAALEADPALKKYAPLAGYQDMLAKKSLSQELVKTKLLKQAGLDVDLDPKNLDRQLAAKKAEAAALKAIEVQAGGGPGLDVIKSDPSYKNVQTLSQYADSLDSLGKSTDAGNKQILMGLAKDVFGAAPGDNKTGISKFLGEAKDAIFGSDKNKEIANALKKVYLQSVQRQMQLRQQYGNSPKLAPLSAPSGKLPFSQRFLIGGTPLGYMAPTNYEIYKSEGYTDDEMFNAPDVPSEVKGQLLKEKQLFEAGQYEPPTSFLGNLQDTAVQAFSEGVPWGDEILAKGAELVGQGDYDTNAAKLRGLQNYWREKTPGQSLMLGLAESLPFAGVAGTGAKALGLGRNVAAQSAGGKMLKAGLATGLGGATYGSGEGEGSERVGNAVAGGLLGSLLGMGGSRLLLGHGGDIAKTQTAQRLAKDVMPNEAGAILPSEAMMKGRVSPLTQELLGLTEQIPTEQLQTAAAKLAAAEADKIPLWLAEAVDSPELIFQGKRLANEVGGREVGQKAIRTRAEQQGERLATLFDTVSKETNVEGSAASLQELSKSVLSTAKKERAKMTSPLYKRMFEETGEIASKSIDDLGQNSKNFQRALSSAMSDAESTKLGPMHSQVIAKTYRIMRDRGNKLMEQGQTAEGRDWLKEADRIERALDNVTEGKFTATNRLFSELSKDIEKQQTPLVETFQNLAQGNRTNTALTKLFKASPEDLKDFIKIIGPKSATDLKNVVRGWLQKKINSTPIGDNILRKGEFATPDAKARLKLLLGEEDYSKLEGRLDQESKIAYAQREYNNLPQTAPLLQAKDVAEKRGVKAWKWIDKPKRMFDRYMESLWSSNDEVLNEALARAFFDTAEGRTQLEKLIPLHADRSQYLNSLTKALISGDEALQTGIGMAPIGSLAD